MIFDINILVSWYVRVYQVTHANIYRCNCASLRDVCLSCTIVGIAEVAMVINAAVWRVVSLGLFVCAGEQLYKLLLRDMLLHISLFQGH